MTSSSSLREIHPVGPVHGTVRPPGSKSITNRALLIAALAEGRSTISHALASDDTRYMLEAVRALGLNAEASEDGTTIILDGSGGTFPARAADLYVGNAGTAMRFLTAALCLGKGEYRLDGEPRMRQRPIGDLADGLTQLGATIHTENGYPPVTIHADRLPGGECTISGRTSSQFISALLIAAPYARQDVTVRIEGGLVSRPYIDMTRRVMADFGVRSEETSEDIFTVPAGQVYRDTNYPIEPDASGASYFFAAAAVTGGTVRVEGLGSTSIQGDMGFVDLLEEMGCTVHRGDDWTEVTGGPLHGIETDMADISDTAMTLAAVALFAEGPTKITGIANVRVKECDRIAAVAAETAKLGARVDEYPDGMTIHPLPSQETVPQNRVVIETYNDHRIAMSFAIAGLKRPGVVIADPECVNKTFPGFFDHLWGA